jgi:Fe/S biogenesis protein NfuA
MKVAKMTEKIDNGNVIEITQAAVDKIAEIIAAKGRGSQAVRVVLRGRAPSGGFQSEFMFVDVSDQSGTDLIQDAGPFPLYFDQITAESLRGAKVDFDEKKFTTGFHIEYSQQVTQYPEAVKKEWDDPVAINVQKVVDEQVNPALAGHGGWVLLLDVKDDTAFIEMGGGCRGCAISHMTLKQGVEGMILENVPEIKKVVDTTDHAGGTNPYYAQAEDAGQPGVGAPPSEKGSPS